MQLLVVLAIVAVVYWFFMGGDSMVPRKGNPDKPAAAQVAKPAGTPIVAGAPTPLGGGSAAAPTGGSAVRRPIDRSRAVLDMAKQRSGDIE